MLCPSVEAEQGGRVAPLPVLGAELEAPRDLPLERCGTEERAGGEPGASWLQQRGQRS